MFVERELHTGEVWRRDHRQEAPLHTVVEEAASQTRAEQLAQLQRGEDVVDELGRKSVQGRHHKRRVSPREVPPHVT